MRRGSSARTQSFSERELYCAFAAVTKSAVSNIRIGRRTEFDPPVTADKPPSRRSHQLAVAEFVRIGIHRHRGEMPSPLR